MREFWENVGQIMPCLHFFSFFKAEISSHTPILLLCKDQSTVAQWAETTVTECSLKSCMRANFLIGSHTIPGQQHSQPTPTFGGQGCTRVLGVTYHLHFWQNDRGLLHATAVTQGWNRQKYYKKNARVCVCVVVCVQMYACVCASVYSYIPEIPVPFPLEIKSVQVTIPSLTLRPQC